MNESAVDAFTRGGPPGERSAPRLTPRERDILSVYATGVTVDTIAREKHIANQTVRNHLTAIYRKLGVSGSVEAFVAMGWLRVP